jgi:Septum formation
MRSLVIGIGLVGLVAIGGLILRPFLTGEAAALKVGECFDVPADLELIEDVQHRPCTDAHTAEVVFVQDVEGADGAPFPSIPDWEAMIDRLCVPAFNAYTGLDFHTDPTWGMGYFSPTAEGWDSGDRGVICYATRVDAQPTNQSIKAG